MKVRQIDNASYSKLLIVLGNSIDYIISTISNISEFYAKRIKMDFDRYKDEKTTKTIKKNVYNNLFNLLDKVSSKEKKIDNNHLISLLNVNLKKKLIDLCAQYDINNIDELVKLCDSDSISTILKNYIKKYIEVDKLLTRSINYKAAVNNINNDYLKIFQDLNRAKKREEVVDLPKSKAKPDLFYEALNNNHDLIFDSNESINNREAVKREYLTKVFDLKRRMRKNLVQSIDIKYDLDEYYKISSLVLNQLYNELFMNNGVPYEVINTYGGSTLLDEYDKIFDSFTEKVEMLPKYITNIFKSDNDKLRMRSLYFKNIKTLIPSRNDIVNALNTITCNQIKSNMYEVLNRREEDIEELTQYLSIDEVVNLYRELEIILKDDAFVSRSNHFIRDFTKIQEIFCKLVYNKYGYKAEPRDVELYLREICHKVFNEEAMFDKVKYDSDYRFLRAA